MNKTANIPGNLKRLMKAHGVSQNQLWHATGVSQPTIKRILDGDSKDPRRSNLDKLAAYFGITTEQLIYGEDYAEQPLMGFVSEPATEYDECEALARRIERLPPEDQARVADLIDRLLAE